MQKKNPFAIENDNHFRVALASAIWKLVPMDIPPEDLLARGATLNHHERLYWAVEMFDSNACADGTGHVFYYGYGILLPYILEGLREIGADETAEGLQQYVNTLFCASMPRDEEAMQKYLDENQALDEQAEEEFPYFQQSDVVIQKLVAWARANRANFRVD